MELIKLVISVYQIHPCRHKIMNYCYANTDAVRGSGGSCFGSNNIQHSTNLRRFELFRVNYIFVTRSLRSTIIITFICRVFKSAVRYIVSSNFET